MHWVTTLRRPHLNNLGNPTGNHILCLLIIESIRSCAPPCLAILLTLGASYFDAFSLPTFKHVHSYFRFISVTDRFLAELGPVAMGLVSKDHGAKYENLVKGLTHIKIKVILF